MKQGTIVFKTGVLFHHVIAGNEAIPGKQSGFLYRGLLRPSQ
jgi:hypothetical protein